MSVQSMACPKCGKQATEYDEGKWHCLNPRCQIKFVYEKPSGMVVHNTNIVDVCSDSLYDIDMSNKEEHEWEKVFGQPVKHSVVPLLFFSTMLLLCIWGMISVYINAVPGEVILFDIGIGIAAVFFGLGCFGTFVWYMETPQRPIVAHKYYLTCPHCKKIRIFSRYSFTDENGQRVIEDPAYTMDCLSGLQHCLNCGKQVVVTRDYTLGIIRK